MRRWIVQAGLVLLWMAPCAAVAQDYPRYRAVGSTYVPLDSWSYSVFERLAAQGYVQTAMLGMKPWTRFECARLVDEASEILRARVLEDKRVDEQAAQAVEALEREFAYELDLLGGGPHRTARLESLYARVTSISGPPLTDGLHFGQTISYDFGRPNRRGTNAIAGGSAYASAGPLAVYIQGEYQHAPSAPAISDQLADVIAMADGKPRETPQPFAVVNRARLMDAYVALNVKNYQVSFGQQSLSWGIGEGGSLLLSNNAEPFPMFRISRVVPQKFPWILRYLGPTRSEFFFGRLDGQTAVPRPFIYGMKTTIKPHRRLELAYARTTLIGGGNFPLTIRTFFQSLFARFDKSIGTNPGDTRDTFDLHWLLPGLSDSVTFYWELFEDDNEFFFIRPGRGALRTGFYLARLPGLPQVDFRIEAASTESPGDHISPPGSGRLNYWNFQYRDGYAHQRVLLGNTVGRAGRTIQFWSSYWFSPRSKLQFHYKNSLVLSNFIPGGGRWQDYGLRYEKALGADFVVRSQFQVELISRFPVLFPGRRTNVAATVEIRFLPSEGQPWNH